MLFGDINGNITGQFGQMDVEIAAAVDEAIAFAKASPLPKPEDALLHVFAP